MERAQYRKFLRKKGQPASTCIQSLPSQFDYLGNIPAEILNDHFEAGD
jgi:transposase